MSPATASFRHKLRAWAQRLKLDSLTLWFALRHAQTPLLAKAACAVAVGYALSPIDLIPDFIPVLGYLDDLILVPALIWLAMRMLPAAVLTDCREQADAWIDLNRSKPRSYLGAIVIVSMWIAAVALAWYWLA